jgi:hypothetical protein
MGLAPETFQSMALTTITIAHPRAEVLRNIESLRPRCRLSIRRCRSIRTTVNVFVKKIFQMNSKVNWLSGLYLLQ